MLKALFRVLKSEKYGSLLLLILFIFNSAVFLKISGDEYQPSTGAANLLCIAPAEQSSTCAPMNCGVGGNIVNQLLNGGYLSAQSYSAIRGDCSGASANGRSLQEYFETVAQEDTKKFSLSNTLGDINTQVLAQRPASAAIYVQDKVYALTNFNKVSAQSADYEYYSPGGTGFSLLRPIQNFWSWAVRVVYGFLLLIVIIIAFAIMFRQRLSGNVEVTIQSAIPSIALAMILVPLSYAISGLFIDVITVGTNMVHSFLIGAPGSPGHELFLNAPNIQSYTLLGEPETVEDRGFYPDDVRVDWLRARNNLNAKGAITDAAEGIGDATILPLVDAFVKIIANGSGVSDLSFTWVGDLVQFFISIVSIWIAIQVFIALIKKYLVLITYPIISPFIFATVAIPGNGTKSIMQYAKVMMAASLAFIVTYAMFLLSIIFTSTYFQNDIPAGSTAAFSPPLLGLGTLGLTSGDTTITKLLLTLIGLGIYFSIPNTLKSIDKALGADQPLPKFITTPIESFNESRKVMFKTAPSAVFAGGANVIKGIRGGAKGIADARATASRVNATARTAAMNYYNFRKGGLRASDKGSAQYNLADSLSKDIQAKEAARVDALNKGRYGEARKLAGEIDNLKKEASDLKVDSMLRTQVKPEDVVGLKATFKGNSGSDNEFAFKTADVDAIVAKGAGVLTGGILTPASTIGGGKLVLEAVGKDNVLPTEILVEVIEVQQDATTGDFTNLGVISTLSRTSTGKGTLPLGVIYSASKQNLDNIAQLVCSAETFAYTSKDSKKIEIPFDLRMDAVTVVATKKLFGDGGKTAGNSTYTGGWIDSVSAANVRPNTSTMEKTIRFRIGNLESDPIKIAIKYIAS